MDTLDDASVPGLTPLDRFATDLQDLRDVRGISYSDLAVRVTALRVERGMLEAAARTPRSTVYTCFRTGRARIDTELLSDIVLALTDDEEQARLWVARYLGARRQSSAMRSAAVETSPKVAHTAPSISPSSRRQTIAARLSPTTVLLVVVGAVALNRLGMEVNAAFGFSLFLDMIGTCAAAIILGPWFGVVVGLLHHAGALVTYPDANGLFVLVNITGALVWGYGIRRFRMGNSMLRFTLLGIIAAAACSLVGIPINMFLAFIGATSGMESSVLSLESAGVSFEAALVSANFTASVIDKFLAGCIAAVIFVYLHRQHDLPAGHMPLVEHLSTVHRGRVSAPARSLWPVPASSPFGV